MRVDPSEHPVAARAPEPVDLGRLGRWDEQRGRQAQLRHHASVTYVNLGECSSLQPSSGRRRTLLLGIAIKVAGSRAGGAAGTFRSELFRLVLLAEMGLGDPHAPKKSGWSS